MPGYS